MPRFRVYGHRPAVHRFFVDVEAATADDACAAAAGMPAGEWDECDERFVDDDPGYYDWRNGRVTVDEVDEHA